MKEHKYFSWPLFKQDIKSNWLLTLVIVVIMCLMANVVNFAMNLMGDRKETVSESTQEDFTKYLTAMAAFNKTTGSDLSVEDFEKAKDLDRYEFVFEQVSEKNDEDLSVDGLKKDIEEIESIEGSIDPMVERFEYAWALNGQKGVFTGDELDMDGMVDVLLDTMGIDEDTMERMADMDPTTMINKMYFTAMGLLPLFLYVVLIGNSLIASQVDNGSMAYVLSTPTRRTALTNTQIVFMLVAPFLVCAIVCAMRCVSTRVLTGSVNIAMNCALYGGMYLLAEALGGLCFLGSCLFNQTKKSAAFGGGIAVWCFLASLLGMFGSQDMIDMGAGVEELGIFNKLTLVGLFDVQSLSTVGTGNVDTSFVWPLAALALIAFASYFLGSVYFKKKDLPL